MLFKKKPEQKFYKYYVFDSEKDNIVIKRVEDQYKRRIDLVKSSNRTKKDKNAEIKLLKNNMVHDPRKPNVLYKTQEIASKNQRKATILDNLSEKEFLQLDYVLTWSSKKPDLFVSPYFGDITDLRVDAIVKGISESIEGNNRKFTSIVMGKALSIDKTIDLKPDHIIHTSFPFYRERSSREENLLYKSYLNSLLLAEENNLHVVALPILKTQIYKFPSELVQKICLKALTEFTKGEVKALEQVILVIN